MRARSDPDAFAIAVALRAALAKLNRRLRAQDEPGGIGSTGLSLLGRLYRDGPTTASALANGERLAPQSLTRTLRALEAKSLIVRTSDAADRRRVTIALTGPGVEVLRRSVRSRESWLTQALETTLSPTERELVRLTATLIERLADADVDVDPDADADADADDADADADE